jgi:alkylation response protein AidB-like acyl-CoA dehydrogenase
VIALAFDLNHGEDQRQILDSASAMLESGYPVSRLREHARDDLSDIAGFGTFSLALPEDAGGAGFSLVEEALVHVLLGRHLVSTRALATSIAARLAGELGRADLASGAAAGDLSVCAALRHAGSVLLVDPAGAEFAVVFADGKLGLVAVEPGAGEEIEGLGHGTPLTRISDNAATAIGETGDGALTGIADLLVSAQLLGIAEASRDLAVSYARVRQQFGKPIGAFQAIKHRCADMAIGAGMLSAQLDFAAIALRDGRDDAAFQVAALRLLAPNVALANARACIQIHGGIGFSAEADAHHFLKQAHLLSRLGRAAPLLDLPAPLAPCSPLNERN